uniref:Transporter n=1 Tax=Scylla olivacea TaxID=85551 RepID=A0A0P4W0H7_SCYOL
MSNDLKRSGGSGGGGETKEREQWNNKLDFLLSVIGFCVGLGNVWRFPYLCYKNGGGAFLIPYCVCALLGGMPMFFLEVGIGQFMSEGGISVWKMCPLFQGIGYAAIVVCNWLNVYYIVIIAWALYYFVLSFQAELPWSSCGNWWNTDVCVDGNTNHSFIQDLKALNLTPKDSVVEFWDNRVLQITEGVHEMGTMVWPLFGALIFSWLCTYFAIWKGVKVTGKIMYFTGTSHARQLALIEDLCHHHQQPVTSFPFAILGICEIAAILSQTSTNPDESDRRS